LFEESEIATAVPPRDIIKNTVYFMYHFA